ncbi:MAG: hypothetical protein GXO78_07895 [Calditrichaeota bacterium]|nr:hypothetical protein [Calditrichota bacterium]
MAAFFKMNEKQRARHLNREMLRNPQFMQTWSVQHMKILRHAGLGGKNHTFEKGHVYWNRKGRW